MPVSAPPLGAYASLAAAMAVVGGYVGLSKVLVGVFPVLLLAWLRFGIAAVAMAGWVGRGPAEAPLSAQDRRLLFWESFFGNFLFSLCMLAGVALTSALAAGVVMAAIPAAVALLSRWLLAERIAPRTALGIACAVAGIVALTLVKADAAPAAAQGVTGPDIGRGLAPPWRLAAGYLLLVVAVFCEATYVVLGKRLTGAVSPRRISALINLWGLALATPFGLWAAWRFDFGAVEARMWLLLAVYALAASMLTVWLWMNGLRRVPASRAGVFTVMLPVSAAAVGVLVLGEPFGAGHVAALALALAGVVLACWPARDDPASARAASS